MFRRAFIAILLCLFACVASYRLSKEVDALVTSLSDVVRNAVGRFHEELAVARLLLVLTPVASFESSFAAMPRVTKHFQVFPSFNAKRRLPYPRAQINGDVVDFGQFVLLKNVRIGRYNQAPALFLEKESGGKVFPVPVPPSTVRSLEDALRPQSGVAKMAFRAFQGQNVVYREHGLFDNLPWEWNPSSLAKADALSRVTRMSPDTDSDESLWHMVLNSIRKDAAANPSAVFLENEGREQGVGVKMGGRLLLERRLPETEDFGKALRLQAEISEAKPVVRSCFAHEAMGVAIALGTDVYVEKALWEALAVEPAYNPGDNQLDIKVGLPEDEEEGEDGGVPWSWRVQMIPLPWEIKSIKEVHAMSIDDKAACFYRAFRSVPPHDELTDELLMELLLPNLDENVRRDWKIEQATQDKDMKTVQKLENQRSIRGKLMKKREGVLENYHTAVEKGMEGTHELQELEDLDTEIRRETNLRGDVTRDVRDFGAVSGIEQSLMRLWKIA